MIEIPGMLMVGARCKSDGKTAFTRTLIERFSSQYNIVGVKVTTVDSFNTSHHPYPKRNNISGVVTSF